MEKRTIKERLLIILHLILGLGGIFGGLAFLVDTKGGLMGMTVESLAKIPFLHSFLLPGIWLLVVFGVAPLVVAYGFWKLPDWDWADKVSIMKSRHWTWSWSLILSMLLMTWMWVQFWMFETPVIIQWVFLGVGLAILAITLILLED